MTASTASSATVDIRWALSSDTGYAFGDSLAIDGSVQDQQITPLQQMRREFSNGLQDHEPDSGLPWRVAPRT